MLKNNIKFAIRNILRHKGFSIINIVGLAIALSCCILISLYVLDELSYDRYSKNADRIYRLRFYGGMGEQMWDGALSPYALGPIAKNNFPEIENYVRFQVSRQILVKISPQKSFNEKVAWTDNTLFHIFDLKLLKGNQANALTEPNSAVLSRKYALKYFGNENPIGKELKVGYIIEAIKITGVVDDIPQNSHFSFDIFVSISSLGMSENNPLSLTNIDYYTYVLLKKDSKIDQLEEKITNQMKKLVAPIFAYAGFSLTGKDKITYYFKLQPLTSIHLHSNLLWEIEENGDIKNIMILIAIVLLLLAIGCINYINLSISRASARAREIGIRKSAGAVKKDLIKQFLGETFLMVLISIVLALVFAELALPLFNGISDKTFTIGKLFQPDIIILLISISLGISLASGIYPAFYLSKFKPVEVLKSGLVKNISGGTVRKILVLSQFLISITLIISTITISNQMDYMRRKNLGIKKEQQLVIKLQSDESRKNVESIKNELSKNKDILNIVETRDIPFSDCSTYPCTTDNKEKIILKAFRVGYNFLKNFKIHLIAGRDFSRDMATDRFNAVIINEAAAKYLGWSEPIGRKISRPLATAGQFQEYTIIGVAKDFNYTSLHSPIEPLMIVLIPDNSSASLMTVNMSAADIDITLAYVKKVMNKIAPSEPFEYYFLDSKFDSLFQTDKRLGQLVQIFSVISIFISCIGLLGLATNSAQKRTKEIGIRKSIGATSSSIFGLLVSEFIKWILSANLIAWPLAYWIMNKWLQSFAFRTSISIWSFIFATAVSFIIAILAVSYQAYKASVENPIKALRYE